LNAEVIFQPSFYIYLLEQPMLKCASHDRRFRFRFIRLIVCFKIKTKEAFFSKKSLLIYLVFLFFLLCPLGLNAAIRAESQVYYVAPDGNDSYPGTQSQPWKTISRVNTASLNPGDQVLFMRGGTWNSKLSVRLSGNASNPIMFSAYGMGDNPSIQGLEVRTDSTYLIFNNLTFENANGAGVFVDERAHHITLDHCLVQNNTGDGIYFFMRDNGGQPNFITDNIIRDNGSDAGIHSGILIEAASAVQISGNEIYHNGYNDPKWGYSHGIYIDMGATDVEIHDNIVHDNPRGHGIQIKSSANVYRNVVYNNAIGGIYFGENGDHDVVGNIYSNILYDNWFGIVQYAKGSGNKSLTIYNNSLYHNNHGDGSWTGEIMIENTITSLAIINNIIYAHADSEGNAAYNIAFQNNAEIDHNCVYNSGTGSLIRYGGSAQSWSSWQNSGFDIQGINADPAYQNPDQVDFHLQPNSPCIDAGINVGLIQDFDQVSIPQGLKPDMGAFEYPSGSPPTPTPTHTPPPSFEDVPADHPYYSYIQALFDNGYVAGCSTDPLMYCPERIMNRAESSVFVERGIHGAEYDPSDPTVVVFDDVVLDAWYADWVHGLWDDGYTAGCNENPLEYCPDRSHTRAEGCVFYLRMMYGADYVPSDPQGYFADVDREMWYARWVDACWEAGIAEPCATEPVLLFCPEEGLTRAVAAYMMVQAKGMDMP
jgi:hypothetical protein